jgi:hypothetical protein
MRLIAEFTPCSESTKIPSGHNSLEICLSREHLTRSLQQHDQHLEGLRVQLDADSLFAKLSRGSVCFKYSEAIALGWPWFHHVVRRVYPIARSIQESSAMYNFPEVQLKQSLAA